ncbi:MAG: CCA tRNA nucleotidyltransferase, partial [Aestuariivirgaceae bacterium]|nr:CCA tRNA nucleotidyltransferase [Aestuariivirgaceae bacterium]
ALLGVPVTEVDVATSLSPEAVMERAAAAGFSVHPTGLEHGTVTVARDGAAFEVTTLRHDVETDGRRAKVAFTDDWQADARRRDFTMNALYCSATGEVFDPVSGMDDLLSRRVRFVGEAGARIAEDYLRILRFFRFHAQYGQGGLDEAGLAACGELKAGLRQLSAERVRQELMKLLVAPGSVAAVEAMRGQGILEMILPGADVAVFARMAGIDSAEGFKPDAVLRLAALAPQMAAKEALRLSNAEGARLEALACAPALSPAMDDIALRRARYVLGDLYEDAVRLVWARSDMAGWRAVYALVAEPTPVFPLKGADLLARGLKPGPDVGRMLRSLEEAWIVSDFSASKEALLERVQNG